MIEILKDIWRNYKTPIIISSLFLCLVNYYSCEMDSAWRFFAYTISASPLVAVLVYGINEYFKK